MNLKENTIDQKSGSSPIEAEGSSEKETANLSVDNSLETLTKNSNTKENDACTNSSFIEKQVKIVKNESTPSVAADLTKKLRNMDTTLKENKFIKGLGNFMAGMKNRISQNETDGTTLKQPYSANNFLNKLKQLETTSTLMSDENSIVLFAKKIEVLFEAYDLSYHIMEPTTDGEVVVHLKPENVELTRKFKQLKDSLVELDTINAKKNSLDEEITLYMKYFHSFKDLFEINGSIYLEPLETRLQTLYSSCKNYMIKLEKQIKRYDAILEKFEKVAESKDKKLNYFNDENKNLKEKVVDLTSKLNQTLCIHQEIQMISTSYIASTIQNNIQQNNMNQLNLVAKQAQAALSENKTTVTELRSEKEALQSENISLQRTIKLQDSELKSLNDELTCKTSLLDALNVDFAQRSQQLENELLLTKQLLETKNFENATNSEKLTQLEFQSELDKRSYQVKIKSLQQLIQALKKEKTNNEINANGDVNNSLVGDSQYISRDFITRHLQDNTSNQDDANSLLMTIHSLKEDIQTLNDELNDKNMIIERLSGHLRNHKNNSSFNLLIGGSLANSNTNSPQTEANLATTLQTLVEDLIARNLVLEENVSTLAKELERSKKGNIS